MKRLKLLSFFILLALTSYMWANDCSSPVALTYNNTLVGESTCGAVNNYNVTNSCNNSYDGGEDMIYTYTPATTGTVEISIQNSSNSWTGIYVFDDCPNVGSCVAFQGSSSANETLFATLNAGTEYYIMIDTWPSPTCITSYDLYFGDPAFVTDCLGATVVTDGVYTGNSTSGTSNFPPFCGTSAPSSSNTGVWYTYTTPMSGVFTVDLCASTYDTKVWVYEGTCDALVCVAGNDDFCGTQSYIEFLVGAGETYYIFISGFSTQSGAYTLDISTQPLPSIQTTSGPIVTGASSTDILCEGDMVDIWVEEPYPSVVGYQMEFAGNGPVGTFPAPDPAGTTVGNINCDCFVGPFNIGFDFPYFGMDETQFYVSGHGVVYFSNPSNTWTNQTLPDPTDPNHLIALGWDDLIGNARSAQYFNTTVGGENVLVLNYFVGSNSIQLVLFESGNIEINIDQMVSEWFSGTQGMENIDGTQGFAIPGRNNANINVTSPESWTFAYTDAACNFLGWDDGGGIFTTDMQTTVTAEPGVTYTAVMDCGVTADVVLNIANIDVNPTASPDAITFCELSKDYSSQLMANVSGAFQFELAAAYNSFDDCIVEIDPLTGQTVGGAGTCLAPSPCGGCFIGAGEGANQLMYLVGDGILYSYDPFTNVTATVGNTGFADVTGIAYDVASSTMYGITFAGCTGTAELFTIDLGSGAGTSVATLTGIGGGAITIATNANGGLIMTDICDEGVYRIDLSDFSVTQLCVLPFAINFGQDMTYNPFTGLIYYYAFNVNTFSAQLYTMDPADPCGTLTLVADLGFTQYAGFVYITIPPDYDVVWDPTDPALISDPNIEDPIAWPTLTNNVYTVTVTDNNTGCSVTKSVTIAIDGIDVVETAVGNSSEGSGGVNPFGYNTHTIELSGYALPLEYTWETSGYVRHSVTDEGTIEIIYSDEANWCVTIVDGNGCEMSNEGQPLIFCNEDFYEGANEILDIIDYTITPASNGQNNGSIDITVVGTPPYTFEWSGPNGFTATSEDIYGLSAGWYSVTVTDSWVAPDGTPMPQMTIGWYWVPYIEDGGPGIRGKMETSSLTAAPNPFNDQLNIKFSTANDTPVTLEMYNISGQRVATIFENNVTANTTQTVEVNAADLASGIYFVHLITNDGIAQVYKVDKVSK